MTVRTRHLGRVVIGLVVVSFVAGGLSVEALTRAGVSRAQRALPGALARAVAPEDASESAARELAAARSLARNYHYREAAERFEAVLQESPTHEIHTAAAYAWMAADLGRPGARNAQLAARLAPDDPQAAAMAEKAVDVAVAYTVRPYTRPAGVFGAISILIMAFSALARRRERRRLRNFLEGVSARVQVWSDGEQLTHPLTLDTRTESMTLDVFLSGRYGAACPRRPQNAPSLHLAFSSPGSNQTVRLRPLHNITDNAIRIPINADTLAKLKARPGRWRLHVTLGARPVLAVPIEIKEATAAAPFWRRRAHA